MRIFIGEWIGMLLLLLLGNGTVANVLLRSSKGFNSGWIVITMGWGFAVTIAVYASSWMSGAHLNPAVTLALTLVGKSPPSALPLYFLGQMCGAMSGAFLAWIAYYPLFQVASKAKPILLCFATSPAIKRPLWNLITEVIATAVLLMGILAILDLRNNLTGGFGAYAIGLLILCIGLGLGGPTGFALNPARDLGPRIVHALLPLKGKGSSEWDYALIPILGPFVGGVLGALLYQWYTQFV